MQTAPFGPPEDLRRLIDSQADFITSCQLSSGAIPWFPGGMVDPWDHIECAIALDLAGRHESAGLAYTWSRSKQNADGSWYSSYVAGEPQDLVKDSNFASYIATGIWFHYLATKDMSFARDMWPMVERAIDFTLTLQEPGGEVLWAAGEKGNRWPSAILTSSCCTWHSIKNALLLARLTGADKQEWEIANRRLYDAITEHPELFDRMDENKRRYAMNWFYPVLTGVTAGKEARERIDREWSDLVIENWGCRVAADEDVTAVAETSELIIALCLIEEHERAGQLLSWTLRLRDGGEGFCRGVKLPEQQPCPPERATWTSAALIMAIAAMSGT